MAAMHTPTAAAAAWSTEVKEDVEEGELRRQKTKLSVVYVADSHNNNILRWDAATNRAETIVEEAITPPATTEGEVAADAENEAEAGKEKQSIGAVTVEHFSGNRVFFAAGSRIKAFDAATDAVATVVGDGQFGSCEPGLGTQVRFGGSTAMAVTPSSNDNSVLIYGDASGALMVWDSVSKKVAVLAGKCGVSGHQDGHAINDARLGSKIQGIALDTIEAANGAPMLRAVYFTDASSHTVRRLQWVPAVRGTRLQGVLVDALLSEENAAKAVVTTIAGTPMQAGYVDTQAEKSALFNSPGSVGLAHTGLVAERRTSVYVADQANGVVRVVDPVEQSASTLISLAHTSSFELSSDSKALALSTQEARLYQVDMHSVVNCDEMMRALHLSFKNWVVDEEADIFKEQSLSATATLELPDAQRLGRSRFNIRFYKKVKHVASVEVPDESAGQLDKYLICTSEKAAGAEAPQDCCVRKYATPVKGKQWESKEADLALW